MGIAVLILGASGTGKSTSLRNFKKGEIGIFNVANKPLPFRSSGLDVVNTRNYEQIKAALRRNTLKAYAIDDSQYLMTFEQFDTIDEPGYDKYKRMGKNFYKLIEAAIRDTTPDTVVYFLHHPEVDDQGFMKAKTAGKLIDNWLTLEGLFPIVLFAGTDGEKYWFDTQSNGYSTAKSPLDMFPEKRIDNDLKAVDGVIREYWGLGKEAADA